MSSFTNALHDRLEATAAARAGRRDANAAVMEDRSRRLAAFDPAAEEIYRTIIRPMVEEVARAFDSATERPSAPVFLPDLWNLRTSRR